MNRISRRRALAGLGIGLAATALGAGAAFYRREVSLVPGRSRALPVPSDAAIPAQADAVVIGGGDTGVMAALCLAERGLKVALCEKGVIAGEASGRSFGAIDSLFLSPAKAELLLRTKQLWSELNARVGRDTGFRKSGMALVLQSEEMEAFARQWVDSVKGQPGMDPAVVKCGSVLNLSEAANCRALLYQPSDGQAEPRWVAPIVAQAAREKGVTLHQGCAVRSIERSGGAVSGVVTEHGSIKAKIVIVAGGVWTPLFLGNLGMDLPQLSAFSSGQTAAPMPEGPKVQGGIGETLWRLQADGYYTVQHIDGLAPLGWESLQYGLRFLSALRSMSDIHAAIGAESWRSLTVARHWRDDERTPFEQVRIYEPMPNLAGLAESMRVCAEVHPGMRNARVVERYAGALTTTPDNMPVISAVQAIPGLLLGTGLYFGLTLCPVAGELLADLATGRPPKIDPKPYRYERLIDGSTLTFQP